MGKKRQATNQNLVIGTLMVLLIIELALVIIVELGLFPFFARYAISAFTATEQSSPLGPVGMASTSDGYLHEQVLVGDAEQSGVESVLLKYVRVKDSCGPDFEGECVRVRSGPGTDFPIVYRLRNDVVLKVDGQIENNGVTWYKIVFDEWIRYPERLEGEWYVAADYLEVLHDEGDRDVEMNGTVSTNQKIVVDRSEQKLYAYTGEELFMEADISTGLELTPTPRGTFTVYKKTPSRYMQGPLPNLKTQDYYDLPGVPWNLYFTEGGAVIHGAYWHNSFGSPYSHGCVNLLPENARKIYEWAELGAQVVVQD